MNHLWHSKPREGTSESFEGSKRKGSYLQYSIKTGKYGKTNTQTSKHLELSRLKVNREEITKGDIQADISDISCQISSICPSRFTPFSILLSSYWFQWDLAIGDCRRKWRQSVIPVYLFPWSLSWRVTLGWLRPLNDHCSFQVSLHFLMSPFLGSGSLSPLPFRVCC